MRGGKRCVAAQVDFHRWPEPAQRHKVRAGDDKRGLGKIVPRRDGREHPVGKPVLEQHDRCGIPAEQAGREGIDLIELNDAQQAI